MGKSSKSSYPNYSSGSVTVNGREIAKATKNNDGTVSSSYYMTPDEKKFYDGVQSNLTNSVYNLFNITDSDKKKWNETLDVYKNQGIDEINNIYTPMQTALKNDVASRFGNIDNSVFLDRLENITDNKAKAVASLSNSIIEKQNELYTNEMKNRMNYISLLSGLNEGMNSQIFNYMNMAKSNAESGNNYSSNMYSAQNPSSNYNWWNSAANFGSTVFSAFN